MESTHFETVLARVTSANLSSRNRKKYANSKELGEYPAVAEPVRRFIRSIIDDPNLRWGGTFSAQDPVHIDDYLNKDMAFWDKRYQVMQKAVQLGV